MTKSRRYSKKRLTVTFDRGPAKYFHGRKQVLHNFRELARHSVEVEGGTIFLIQGAPGVGKSALLYECEKMAQDSGWEITEIDPPGLWDPDQLLRYLGKKGGLIVKNVLGEVGFQAGVKLDAEVERFHLTTLDILKHGKKPLLLILDEAQMLGTTSKPLGGRAEIASIVLKAIHNGTLNRPVILLAAGLNETRAAFGKLGISRFSQQYMIELGALNRNSERAIIQDWIIKEGRAKGDITEWIDAIAQETHGWPQHIQAYVKPASDQLKANSGIMTLERLDVALEAGREGRKGYYKQRTDDFRGDQLHCLARCIPKSPREKPAGYRDIMSSLKKEYDKIEAQELFSDFEKKGILEKSGMGYAVPIPSMHTWLKDTYDPE
ncbi:MAG: ATP-binding protein [Bacteroidetes bacterium]|nr:ATP-binding protein [Bacteroidota bacterium]